MEEMKCRAYDKDSWDGARIEISHVPVRYLNLMMANIMGDIVKEMNAVDPDMDKIVWCATAVKNIRESIDEYQRYITKENEV